MDEAETRVIGQDPGSGVGGLDQQVGPQFLKESRVSAQGWGNSFPKSSLAKSPNLDQTLCLLYISWPTLFWPASS